MFEITDDFLIQAGFGSLEGEQREQMRRKVTQDVERRISDRITSDLSERQTAELEQLMETKDTEYIRQIAERVKPGYVESEEFHIMRQNAASQGISEDDILRNYVVFHWYAAQGLDITEIVQTSMNEVMAHLQRAFNAARAAID